MTDIETVEQVLQANGLAFQKGKGGVMALPIEGGFRLVNLNGEGRLRHFNDKQIQLFRTMFPSLKELLVVNAETRRIAENLIERQKNMASVHMESFDKNVPKMPALGSIDASKPSEIPKFYGMVDDVGGIVTPPNEAMYIVSIFASELGITTPVGGVRPDEAMLQFEVKKSELDVTKLKNGTITLKDALKSVSAENVRIIYFDDNNPIRGERRVKHMSKTLKTLAIWVEFLTKEIKFKPRGNVYVHAEDYYGFATVESTSSGQKIKRFGPEAFSSNKDAARRFYLVANLETVQGADGSTTFKIAKGGLLRRIMSGVAVKDRLRIRQESSRALSKIAKALQSLK